MRLVFVISSLSAGGAERVLTQMANHWCTRGHEVTIVTFSAESQQDFYPLNPNVCRRYLNFRRSTKGWIDKIIFNINRLRALRRALQDLSPQAIISFMDSTNVLTVLASSGLGAPTILSVRNNPKSRQIPMLWSLGRKLTYRLATQVVAQTDGAAQWIRDKTVARVVVIPNPARPVEPSKGLREKLILAAGRMVPEKGHDILIDAFAHIHKDWPDWRLVILGDGPLLKANLQHISEAGLNNKVMLPGTVVDIDAWLCRCGIFVHSSRSEGFPNALLEAMTAGAPVVSCDCEFGPRDIIDHRVTGLLVPPDDPISLAHAMAELIRDETLRASLGSNAVYVREAFDLHHIMQRWEALF